MEATPLFGLAPYPGVAATVWPYINLFSSRQLKPFMPDTTRGIHQLVFNTSKILKLS